ncbi:ABC transporter permease [Caproiciproducens sp. CPB-2]|uniref:ABC transporter permease n=1 Tax=Caproiciproducens sp. CPB-2 TaxID=3030017 RepID=UPI0023DB994D|nr:ABC transporter permease [Caproiciproducens sp. CPB-2]MDF1495425.1 ABC transporter permease [Caproiciproducens sp. CPB-2]
MPVFKLCMKIIQKNLSSMMIYVAVFLAVSTLLSLNSSKVRETGFSQEKTDIAFLSEEDSPLIDGFQAELAKTASFVEVPDETEKLQDALFFRSVSYILRIPKGFTQSFMRGEDVRIEKTTVPNSVSNAYIDLNINQYFNTAALYVKTVPGITQEDLVRHLKADMEINTPVAMKADAQPDTDNGFSEYFFNYLAYALSSVLVLGVSAIMLVFNDRDLSRRNFCSPLSAGKINFQFILANLVFTVACWAVMVGFCFLLDYRNIMTRNTAYLVLNSFVFTLSMSGISFLIGNLLKERGAISAVCNVVSLGPCFISGVFVPQELLNSTVLKIASFTPTYWYVKANNRISSLASFSFSSLSEVYTAMLIEAGFAVAFFAVSMVVGKKKRMSS